MCYHNSRIRHLPFGCWVLNDKSVILFNRLNAPIFKFTPGEGVERIVDGEPRDLPHYPDAVAVLIFRYDGTFNEGHEKYSTARIDQLERVLLEWSVAAEATKFDPGTVKFMGRPYLPRPMQDFVDKDNMNEDAHRIVSKISRGCFYIENETRWPVPNNVGKPIRPPKWKLGEPIPA